MQNLNPMRLYIFCTLLLIIYPLSAQNNLVTIKTDSVLKVYDGTFDNNLRYINGREYKPYHLPTNDNPYLNRSSGTGSIFMGGKEYKNKQLTYDIYKDLLIVIPDYFKFSNVYVQINKSEVDSFTIHFDRTAYHLIHYKPNQCSTGIEPGFYERIYNSSQSTLLVKHFVVKGVDNAITTYRHETERYLLHNNRFYNISRKKNLLNLFPENKKKIKRQIKSINYSFKKMTNNQLIHLFNFIDTL